MKKLLLLVIGLIAAGVIAGFAIWTNRTVSPDLPRPPLRSLADRHNLKIGNYASFKRINEKPYHDILTSQFEFITIDGDPNWHFNNWTLRPTRLTFDFTNVDRVVEYAEANRKPVQIHHLVWGEEKWLPEWLKAGDYDKQALLDSIQNHIKTVAGRYKSRVREWSVVNEVFTRSLGEKGLRDWWYDHVGDLSFVDAAFMWAREADPNAKLILNDFNNEVENRISDAMYNYIKDAKVRGVPIDGLGMQMHIDGSNPPNKDEVIKNMRRFSELGVAIYITELDVNMNDHSGSENDRLKAQADAYYQMTRACIESKVCVSLALLGITDKESWYNELGVPAAKPLPFDEKYRPKPAFFSLRDALANP